MLLTYVLGGFNEEMEKISSTLSDEEIVDFFKRNPNPPDKAVHAFAERNKIEHDVMEKRIYGLLSSIINKGRSAGKNIKVPSKQLKEGLKVEAEHTDIKPLQEKIVKDHIAESKKYYLPHLKKMEEYMKKD